MVQHWAGDLEKWSVTLRVTMTEKPREYCSVGRSEDNLTELGSD